MNLIRHTRGTPDSEEVSKFWHLIKSLCNVGAAVGATAHPALALLSVGAEAIDQIQSRVASRRSQEFVEDVADDLYLANKAGKLTVEQIQQVISSEEFNSALLQARMIAARTHQEEKLEALRNAVLNVAVATVPLEDQQLIFLNLIDRFTPIHLQLLSHIGVHTPRLKVENELSNQALQDLNNSGLLKDGRPFTARNRDYPNLLTSGTWEISPIGRKFLNFITKPVGKEK